MSLAVMPYTSNSRRRRAAMMHGVVNVRRGAAVQANRVTVAQLVAVPADARHDGGVQSFGDRGAAGRG